MSKPFIIGVASQKGGVGKTTIAVNLSIALKALRNTVLGHRHCATTNPNVGVNLGLERASVRYKTYDES